MQLPPEWHQRLTSVMIVLLASLIGLPAVVKIADPKAFEDKESQQTSPPFDPLAFALSKGDEIGNYEATVPAQCYTKTQGVANPCWTCHSQPQAPNEWVDWDLQESYAFSDFALTNRWTNLFKDRTAAMAEISDETALEYVRKDNYTPLMNALDKRKDYPGYRPDLDFRKGFDHAGFARDGSQWRAFRYKPFPGAFWPTNGHTDDVMIRLPKPFRTRSGQPHREIYKINLSLLEAAIASPPSGPNQPRAHYPTEPLSEELAQLDLNGDGEIKGMARTIASLPDHYVGDAASLPLHTYVYPRDTEFLHSVRYIDPDKPGQTGTRMKELRYARKVLLLDSWAMTQVYEKEYNEKEEGSLPSYAGSPLVGLRNRYGWQLQGFIEDAEGRLRLQTTEEHQFCMGCHGSLGITVDHSFSLPRKVPGAQGWGYQDLNGIQDVPQIGHEKGEVAVYLERVGGGDEFRTNREILKRFFENGKPLAASLERAAPGGDRDWTSLIFPSRERAMALNKAYMAIVTDQQFEKGRDIIIDPIDLVHRKIENGTTDLGRTGRVFRDGRIWLDWGIQRDPRTDAATPEVKPR